VSVAGIDKTSGWGSKDANGNLLVGHEADQGINHLAGLSEFGLDTGSAPYVRTLAPTGMTTTAVVVNWQTTPASPAGSIRYRLAGSSGAYTTVAEAAGTKTAHSIPLSGLTAATTYEYLITQPSPVVGGVAVEFIGRVHTTGGTGFRAPDAPGVQRMDGPAAPAPVAQPVPVQTQAQTQTQEGGGHFAISAVTLDPDPEEIAVLWRTDVYADGSVECTNPATNFSVAVLEPGNKRLNHEVVVTGLDPSTTYLVRVISADANGNRVVSEPEEVTTLEA